METPESVRASRVQTGVASSGEPPTQCGLVPLPPEQRAEAASLGAAQIAQRLLSTVEGRTRLAQEMANAMYARVYEPRTYVEGGETQAAPLPGTDDVRLNAALYLIRQLGSGNYGTVCSAAFRPSLDPSVLRPRLPLAIKRNAVPFGINQQQRLTMVVREAVVTVMLSLLVTDGLCANFPCVYGACAQYPGSSSVAQQQQQLRTPLTRTALGTTTRGASSGWIDLFQEVAGCDLNGWASGALRSEAEWMSVAFQVCAGMAWAARVYGITNNDLFARNILVARIAKFDAPPDPLQMAGGAAANTRPAEPVCQRTDLDTHQEGPIFRYNIQTRDHTMHAFTVRTRCWLAYATDYALSSSDTLRALGVDIPSHEGVAAEYGATPGSVIYNKAPSKLTARNLALALISTDAGVHTLFHRYLNAYARDIATFLMEIAARATAPMAVRRWALFALQRMTDEIASHTRSVVSYAQPSRTSLSSYGAMAGTKRSYSTMSERTQDLINTLRSTYYQAPLATAGAAPAPRTSQFPGASLLGEAPNVVTVNDAFRTPDDLIDFITTIFQYDYLAAAGLPTDLFQYTRVASRDQPTDGQTFTLPLTAVPPAPSLPAPNAPLGPTLQELASTFGVAL